jgi:hypothetical protein
MDLFYFIQGKMAYGKIKPLFFTFRDDSKRIYQYAYNFIFV